MRIEHSCLYVTRIMAIFIICPMLSIINFARLLIWNPNPSYLCYVIKLPVTTDAIRTTNKAMRPVLHGVQLLQLRLQMVSFSME